MYDEYGKRFKEIGKTAVIATGSAPGLICAAARRTMQYLDTCDTIYNIVYEGVEAKRFLPFWWSPVTALSDMGGIPNAFENGEMIQTEPFGRPIYRTYDYVGKEIRFVEHDHDEPVHMGLNAKEFFKGAKNIYFKYAGSGVTFAEPIDHRTQHGEKSVQCQTLRLHLFFLRISEGGEFCVCIKNFLIAAIISSVFPAQ